MLVLEILVGLGAVSIVIGVFAKYIYNKMHGINTECEICKKRGKRVINNIRKELNKELINE